MTDRPDPDLVIAAWLQNEAPERAPERLLTASRDRIQSTHQRRGRWPAWRLRQMNIPIRLAVGVAAIAVVAVLGIVLVSGSRVATPPETPPTASPTALTATGYPTAVAAGYRFTCAVTTRGGVRCWGTNSRGQLGNGTTTDSITPVDVSGLTSGVHSIAPGFEHACALTREGGVKCWGRNDGGQLGNDTTTDSSIPVDVSGLTSGVTAIASGGGWSCALVFPVARSLTNPNPVTGGGGVKCWGWNATGELGNGTTKNVHTPVDVAGLDIGAIAITGGGRHTCALTNVGGVKCFGDNYSGELGDGSTTDSSFPVDVAGLPGGAFAIAASDYHTCALLRAGGVSCWGRNAYGQLGNGTTTGSSIPVDVSGLATGVTAIAASRSAYPFEDAFHTCVLMTGGGVKCWGLNGGGQLGDGTTTNSSIPVDVTGLGAGALAITTGGGGHSCALMDGIGIKCWGENDQGQLGDGTTVNRSIPVDVKGL